MEQTVYSNEKECAPSWTGPVREDPAGTLTAALSTDIHGARSLLRRAESLADDGGFARWREQFSSWRDRCGETLQSGFEREAAVEFYRATRAREVLPGDRWQDGRRATVKTVEDMVQLLVALRATLTSRGAPAERA
jgi:hypothetical protein